MWNYLASLFYLFCTQGFLLRGIVDWSPEIGSILADGELLLQQAASASGPGLVSILIEVHNYHFTSGVDCYSSSSLFTWRFLGSSKLWQVCTGCHTGKQEWISFCQGNFHKSTCLEKPVFGPTDLNIEQGVQSRGHGRVHRVCKMRYDQKDLRRCLQVQSLIWLKL